MKVLVLGGSGFVGRALLEALQRDGHRATVPTRRARSARELGPLPGVTVVVGDVLNEAGLLERLLPGHDAVVNLIAILHGDAAAFERAHVELPTKLARACRATGVTRLVHISALGADPAHGDSAPSLYLRSKSRGEAVLHAAGGLQLTVLRPSVIFGADDRFLNLFAQLQRVLPVLPLAGAQARFQPVWVEDVARAVLGCLRDPATTGQTYELCGPDVLTLRQLVQLAGRASGHARPVLPLPPALARWQARLMELLPGPTLMSRDNLDSMRVDNIASKHLPGLNALGIMPASVMAIAPGYLRTHDRCVELRAR